jgi:hypothetical protein
MVKAEMRSIPKRRTAASKVNGPDAERAAPGSNEWIILTSYRGHVTVGHHDPSDDEIQAACQQLGKRGSGGWLAVMEGDYFGPGEITLRMVREIAPAKGWLAAGSWAEAVATFERRRQMRNRVRPVGE